MAQINPTVGDIEGNTTKIIDYIGKAKKHGSTIIAFPELAITGYPPEDLLLKPRFIQNNILALDKIKAHAEGIIVIVGYVDSKDDIYNSAAILANQQIIDIYHKQYLPNYGVFDENRYFQAGDRCPVYEINRVLFGVTVCEDIWYAGGPVRTQALSGAEVIININASPYHYGKTHLRHQLLASRAVDNRVIIAYINMVGGQDELVFDGGSLIMDQEGVIVAKANLFEEALIHYEANVEAVVRSRLKDPRRRQEALAMKDRVEAIPIALINYPTVSFDNEPPTLLSNNKAQIEPSDGIEEVYNALMTGLRDYVVKNGFKKVVIGLSGGVDSALVATVAADALGESNVTAIFMPSAFSSNDSREDAQILSQNLGVRLIEIPIGDILDAYKTALAKLFEGKAEDITEENLQARIRGNLLMAMSNKFGWLVVTTGNKSEMSVGYATLYGDMAGGFALIKDVPKMTVYELCRWRNQKANALLIPERILTKAPTAELRANQKDSDSLPEYHLLDPIIKAYVEQDLSLYEIIELGADADTAKKVISMIDHAEYKRRQAPPGVKITPRAFGRDRRFPITNRFRNY
jgi:NAD+ synthase (glutamine-hydrolysing)